MRDATCGDHLAGERIWSSFRRRRRRRCRTKFQRRTFCRRVDAAMSETVKTLAFRKLLHVARRDAVTESDAGAPIETAPVVVGEAASVEATDVEASYVDASDVEATDGISTQNNERRR